MKFNAAGGAAEFDAATLGESVLHRLKNDLHGALSSTLGDAGAVHYFIDDVEFNHGRLPPSKSELCLKSLMLRKIGEIVNPGTILVIWQHQPKQFVIGNL